MDKQNIEKVPVFSADIQKDIVAQLRKAVPGVFSEGKIDFKKLKEALGDEIDDRAERYTFSWAGKRDSLLTLR